MDSDPAIRRLAVVWAGLDAERMDEVERDVQRRHHSMLMTCSNERITLDEALGRVREGVGAVPGDPVSSQERPEALPN